MVGFLVLAASSRRALPAWSEWLPPVRDYTPFYALLGVLVIGFAVHYLRKRQEAEGRRQGALKRARDRAHQAGLTADESAALLGALRSSGVSSPETAVTSEVYFNEFLGPILRREHGAGMREAIRSKLFTVMKQESEEDDVERPAHAATANLTVGQQMSVQFEYTKNHITAVVVQVETDAFVIAFPTSPDEEIPLRKSDPVEGTYAAGEAMYAFSSKVRDVVHGKMLACRIAHSPTVQLLHKRGDLRVPSGRKLRFHHLSVSDIDSAGRLDLSIVGSNFSDIHEGVLEDISLGGCLIVSTDLEVFTPKDLVEFSLPVREGVPELEFFGSVVNVSKRHDGAARLHISFLGLDDRSQHAIGLLVARYRRAADKRRGASR